MGVGGHLQARGVGTAGLKPVDLVKQRFQVHHDAVAQDRRGVFAEHTGGQELQLVLLPANYNGVARVVAAVRLDHVIHPAAEDVGCLAFALVAPLGAHDDDGGHRTLLIYGAITAIL